ncbi:MAG: hypothetical protein FWD81_03835 [Methanomassiliicoccaceae archaeon]|nr:hypothetical protein [Methanomassiliicoccaceae archaeon]
MTAYAYEMKMPAKYVELSADEMEYDGGVFPIFIALAVVSLTSTAVSVAAPIAADMGYLDSETAKTISIAAGAVGIVTGVVSGVGILWTATAATSAFSIGASILNLTLKPGLGAGSIIRVLFG